MQSVCRVCKRTYLRVVSERRQGNRQRVFVDERGKAWSGLRCPRCNLERIKAYRVLYPRRSRLGSSKPLAIDKCVCPHIKKGRDGEHKAADFFRSLGYTAQLSWGNGPDIVLSKGSLRLTCEVKTVTHSIKRRRGVSRGHTYTIGKVCPKREGDDLLAIVLPNDKIHVEPMAEHVLRYRNKKRRVNVLVRAYD